MREKLEWIGECKKQRAATLQVVMGCWDRKGSTAAWFMFRFRVQGPGFRVQGSGSRVQGSGFRVQGPGFRVQDSGFRVQGSGFRVCD